MWSGFLRRLAMSLRFRGGFASAADSAAVLRRLEAIDARLDALGSRQQELRAAVVELRKAQRHLATRDDVSRAGRLVEESHRDQAKLLGAVRRDGRRERQQLDRVGSQVEALLRRLFLEPDDVTGAARLQRQRFGVFSQNGEDGLILALTGAIGPGDRRFVEIGCADHGWNTGFLAEECGWTGLMVDSDEAAVAATGLRFRPAAVRAVSAFLTPDTMDSFLHEQGFVGEFDLLSIDVDGSDYWLWDALTVARPRLVIVEYNAVFGAERAVVVPYQAGRQWDAAARDHRYYGASLRAMQRLGVRKGYRLVAIEPDSANALLLRDDVAGGVPAVDPAAVFRPQRKYRKDEQRRADDIFAVCATRQLPLIDVP
ncbi:MAG: hypothetical protein AB7P99_01410 [Vicinamibacterales bacterium]